MPRGRPRDDAARSRILDAAFRLVGGSTPGAITINQIAEEAGVAKQTIYRWWPSKTAVVLDALVHGTMQATPFPETDDLRADFEHHLRAVVALFRSPTGQVIRELVASAQTDPAIADDFRARFWQPRRDLSLERLERGIEHGWIRRDVDLETVLDAIYGPLWLRLIVGHRPMTRATATHIVDALWPGLRTLTGDAELS